TLFLAEISTDSFASVSGSNLAAVTTFAFTGLTANTSYTVRVAALGNDGALTAAVVIGSTVTLPQGPAASGISSISNTSLRANWGSSGNPNGTHYIANISTDNFATLVNSSDTLNVYADFSSLTPNTTYALQVKSVNAGGVSSGYTDLGSTITLPSIPGAAAA